MHNTLRRRDRAMIERRATERHKVVLPALCWSRTRSDFYAVTVDLSVEGIRLRSAIIPAVDEALTCSIRHIGPIEAKVTRATLQEFAVRVMNRVPPPGTVAKKLLLLSRQQSPSVEPVRVHPRYIPLKTDVRVTLESGSTVAARLLNVSATGAGLMLDEPLEIGATIIIGSTHARVVRCFAHGVGTAFLFPLDPTEISDRTVL